MPSTNSLRAELLRLAAARGPDRSYCPSEAARSLWPDDWRTHMDEVRAEAANLIAGGKLVCTQGGEAVDIRAAKGPVRLRSPE